MEKTTTADYPTADVYTAAYLALHGKPPKLSMQKNRVMFLFTHDHTLFNLLAQFNGNDAVPVVDFVNQVKRVRSMMLNFRSAR